MIVAEIIRKLDGIKNIMKELETAKSDDTGVHISEYTRDDLIEILDAYGDMLARLKVQMNWGES